MGITYEGDQISMFAETKEKITNLLNKNNANQEGEIDIMINQYKTYKHNYATNIMFNPDLQNLSKKILLTFN